MQKLEAAFETMNIGIAERVIMRALASRPDTDTMDGGGEFVSVLRVHPDVFRGMWDEIWYLDDPWRLPLVVALIQQAIRAYGVEETLRRARVAQKDIFNTPHDDESDDDAQAAEF